MTPDRDTIFALSSGRPPAAIAVVRISGPQAGKALQTLIGKVPAPRQAAFARVRDPLTREVIDEALALWFPAPASETGEDIAELQLHGGRAVIAGVLAALAQIGGLRPAEAGEFTRRAFENGKLDLTAVEGLADLIGAETQAQRRQALRQLQGLLGNRAETWRKRLIEAQALLEAGIDFADEGDVPDDLLQPALSLARELAGEISGVLADAKRGERLREGLVVAIAGPPNAGKSTLLNRLARRDVAIVSPYAGTTRDVIEVHLDLDGYPVTLLDTAGIRHTDDPVEREGVARAQARAEAADLVLWVVDATDAVSRHPEVAAQRPTKDRGPSPFEARPLRGLAPQGDGANTWVVRNKIDRAASPLQQTDDFGRTFLLSATTGAGMDALLAALAAHARDFFDAGEPALVTRARHRGALADAVAALRRAGEAGAREELVAEELRLAARALGRLTGRIDVEDILDVIFRDFCIGK